MKFQNPSRTVRKIWHACFERMDTWMDGCMDNPKSICPVNFFEVGDIKIGTDSAQSLSHKIMPILMHLSDQLNGQ